MRLWWLAVGWLSLACGAAGEEATPITVGQELGTVSPVLLVPEALLVPVGQAVALWAEASGGRYQPMLTLSGPAHIRVQRVAGLACGAHTVGLSGCYEQGLLQVSATVPDDQLVATLAHELGHSLGLEDAAAGLMDPHRARAERLAPCVSAQLVAAVGWDGPGACL